MNCHDAVGAQGVLLRTLDGNVVFRVYGPDHSFVDFDVDHSDLSVTITDSDAYFYQHPDGRLSLDHAPQTLGIK